MPHNRPRKRGIPLMRYGFRSVLTAAAGAAFAASVSLLVTTVSGQQASTYRAPRTPDGHPDLNGIWQAVNEANWDIQMHVARPALAVRPGPYGPVPAKEVAPLGAAGAGGAARPGGRGGEKGGGRAGRGRRSAPRPGRRRGRAAVSARRARAEE